MLWPHFVSVSLVLLELLFLAGLAAAIECDLDPPNAEGRLRKHLLCKYDRTLIPVMNKKEPVVISIKMAVKAFNFDDGENVLTVSSWLALFWTDVFLKWTPADYEGINSITEHSSELWQPDLGIFNSDVTSGENEFCKASNCKIDFNGTVSCIPPCMHEANCMSDYRRWPFDTQNCTMHMGTWIHDGSEVDFKISQSYIPASATRSQNREWRMRVATYKYLPGRFGNSSYPTIVFSFQLERHSAAHAAVMLGPALVMVIINLMSLWLAPLCIERLWLICVNIFFHFTYLQQLSWYVPSNGDVCPLIIIFFETSLWVSVLLLLNAIIVRSMAQCHVSAPAWIKSTAEYISSIRISEFCLKSNYLVENELLHNESDETVESAALRVVAKSNQSWETFSKILDRVLFVALFIAYMVMVFTLIPEGYLTGDSKDAELEIIKY